MKSQGLQELIKKIFSDEQTKSRFITDPNSVISQFSLTEEEKKAVLSTHTKIGLATDSAQLEEVIGPLSWWT